MLMYLVNILYFQCKGTTVGGNTQVLNPDSSFKYICFQGENVSVFVEYFMTILMVNESFIVFGELYL